MSSQLTIHYLNSTLGKDDIESFDIQPIGEGMMSDCYRVVLKYQGATEDPSRPNTLICKTSAADSTSRSCGINYGLYQQEVHFYSDLGKTLQDLVPHCYDANFDASAERFFILMRDAAPAVPGDDISGASLHQARLAMQAIGHIHGLSFKNLQWRLDFAWLAGPPNNLDGALMSKFLEMFTATYAGQVDEEDLKLCKLLVENYDTWINDHVESCVKGLLHGDFRLDNLLFGGGGSDALPITVVDWQNVKWAPVLGDVAYFLGGSLEAGHQQDWLQELVQLYVDSVDNEEVMDVNTCLRELKIAAFYGITINIASAVLLQRTERRDKLLPLLLKRHCQFARQLRSHEIFQEGAT